MWFQQCTQSFTISVDNQSVGGGQLKYDAKTGDISLDTENVDGGVVNNGGGITWFSGPKGDESTATVGSLSGNADPILIFSVSATTGSTGSTGASFAFAFAFAFAFDLPIAISGTIATKSEVAYSLTSGSSAGAQIQGIGGKIVQSWDVDTSVGGIGSLNKNVDVGDDYFHLGGPSTTVSSTFSDTDSIIGSLDYDLMSVRIAFALSKNSAVGVSGFVEQTPVPLPGTAWLMISGLGLLAARKKKAMAL